MDKESVNGQMETFMKVNMRMDFRLGLEYFWANIKVGNMKVNGKQEKWMEKVFASGETAPCTLVPGKTVSNMD